MGYLDALGERMLRAGDPWIARRVRGWLGGEADHGRLALHGSTLRVSGARIPLGSRLALTDVHLSLADVFGLVTRGETRVRIDRAELGGVAGFPTIAAFANVSVSKSRWRVDGGDVTCGSASIAIEASGSFGDAPTGYAHAKINGVSAEHVRRLLATFATEEPLCSLHVPDDVVVSGDVTWNLGASTNVALVVDTARSRLTVHFALDEHAALGDIKIVGEVALDDVVATKIIPADIASRVDALSDARATLDVVIAANGAISGAATIATSTSKIDLVVAMTNKRALAGTKLRGALSFSDAFACGLFGGTVRPRRIGATDIDAVLTGTLADPVLVGRASSADLRLRLGDSPTLPTLFFTDVVVDVEVDARRLAWRDLRARILGGSIASSGSVTFGAPLSVDASLACIGVRIERIASRSDGTTPLADQLRGALHADLQIVYAEGALPPFSVRGPLRIIEPEFLLLAAAGEKLARYGLPAPEMRGAGPIEAEIDVRERVARITPIAARLEGIDIDGDVTVDFDGPIQGEIRAHLLQGYLRRSLLLAVPAALVDRLTIPITIAGTLREPDVSADVMQAFDNLLQKSSIGGAVTGVMDEILSTLGGPRSSRSSRPPDR